MKVLLVLTDLYKNVGGGQTVYKKTVEATPDIDFFYFRDREPWDARRPSNAHPIPLLSRRSLRLLTLPPHPRHVTSALEEADQIARSVAGQSFDIVDIPDFFTFGSLLKSAFARHQVKVGRIVLAMHGNISTSIDMNWGSAGDRVLEMRNLERAQFDAADGVYSISPRYMREWQSIIDRDIHYIDPACFVSAEPPTESWLPASSSKPSLYCVGRSERRKGNDLFIEVVRWLDPTSYHVAAHIGDEDYSFNGVSSSYLLNNIANFRGITVEHRRSYDRIRLAALFAEPSVVVLPVRYDSLNLVALEALFSGCPVAVSSKAGVCDYLDEVHPDLRYVKIDLDNFYASVPCVRDLVENYDEHRRTLHARLAAHPPVRKACLDMSAIYGAVLAAPPREANHRHDLRSGQRCSVSSLASAPHHFDGMAVVLSTDGTGILMYEGRTLSVKHLALHLYRWTAPDAWRQRLRPFLSAPRQFVIERIKASGYFGDTRYFAALADAQHVPHRLRDSGLRGERNQDALKEKLGTLYYHASSPLYRCNFWLEIARIERQLGNELMAVTYELRLLRLLGEDRLGLLPRITNTLNRCSFPREAEAVQALYGDPASAEQRVYAFLKETFERLRGRQDKPFEILDDRRDGEAKVAVIVSLYKAANKLKFFLTALSEQTLVRHGKVEVILVDSGSPADERKVFESFQKETPLHVLYARSRERETIQAAWNRGIGLARAPYLVFLGVDETLYPEALEILAQELDDNQDADWVMGNSLVTAVDERGLYKNDIMSYDRTGASKDHVYLETCYLSWVGGMYRKSIHDRFGYYDETFRGAGDTEFKNRILPYIKVKFVDRMLGLFLNYADGQTTMSPMAEIEDSRAWYLYRTLGGVRYAFENRPIEEAEALLCMALGYRKSYCRHISSDIEYASYLARYIDVRKPNSALANAVSPGLKEMLWQMRRIELAERMPTRLESLTTMAGAWRTAARYEKDHSTALAALSREGSPYYKIFNDNRYEQHSWLWKSI